MHETPTNSLLDEDGQIKLPGAGWFALLILAVAAMTMWMLLFPFDFVADKQTTWLAEREIHKLNTLSNVVLFVPLGLISAWLLKLWWPRLGMIVVVLVAIDGTFFSLLGETVQMWLPKRQSSLVDLLANAAGSGIGAMIGLTLAPRLTDAWQRAAAWLSIRSRGKRALMVLLVLLVARTAPFDASPETFYLKESLFHQTKEAGMPFAKTRAWLAGDQGTGRAGATDSRRAEAVTELRRGGLNLFLFAIAAATLLRAAWENRMLTGKDGSGIVGVFCLCVALVLITEVMQWPIRSRLMDSTDPIAGVAGVVVGVMIAFTFGQPRLTPR